MRQLRETRICRNLILLRHLCFDELPGWVVRTEVYFRFCRRFAKVRERYEPLPPARLDRRGGHRNRKFVSRLTDLVIDGFPGSGNSFASNSVRAAIEVPANVESHYHYTSQLKRATALGVPVVVLVRDPAGACNSVRSKSTHTWDWLIVLRWLRFNRHVLRNLHTYEAILFREFTADVDIIRRLSPTVRSLSSGPLVCDPSLRRESETRRTVDCSRPLVAWLMRRALGVYDDIETRLADRQASPVSIDRRARESGG